MSASRCKLGKALRLGPIMMTSRYINHSARQTSTSIDCEGQTEEKLSCATRYLQDQVAVAVLIKDPLLNVRQGAFFHTLPLSQANVDSGRQPA